MERPDGQRRVDFTVGDRSAETFLKLDAGLPEAELYCSDGYKAYDWRPADRHAVGQGGAVNWREGLHSVWRGKLNRLARRTKGYSKSVAMLAGSIALTCWRLGLI